MKNDNSLSRYISLILRHKPEAIGIKLDSHGWADVHELLEGIHTDMQTLERIAAQDSKQRYYLSGDYETAHKVGQRHGRPVVYEVRSGEMFRDGYKFFRSVNGVWLTKNVPVKYLIKSSGLNVS